MLKENINTCNLCPRNCNVNRDEKRGFCLTANEIMIARAALHFWEEPCISGTRGSGAVFFSGCNLRCVYCQNSKIASAQNGKIISIKRLSQIFLELEEKKAHNINLVTPSHYLPQIIKAITLSKQNGLSLPIVYNTSSYEKVNAIKALSSYVDIYMPDFKYLNSALSKRYSNAPDYPEIAKAAIDEMVNRAGKPLFDKDGMMKKGVIVRHLVLPGCTEDSKQIIKYLYETYGDDIYLSIMNQYTPVNTSDTFRELNRKITDKEYNDVIDFALKLGVKNAFIQEGDTADESFIPEFNNEGV